MEYPVSIKGVIIIDGEVLLVKNNRDEWELPGGRIEPGESHEQCLIREIYEELKLDITVQYNVATRLFEVIPGRFVWLTVYLCEILNDSAMIEISDEHIAFGWFKVSDLSQIKLPEAYAQLIMEAAQQLGGFD